MYYNNGSYPGAYPGGQMMTPPTIRAEIIQYGDEAEIDRYPVAVGTSQMFVSKDEQHFVVKNMYGNGQYSLDYYDKRPPAPPKPKFDPDNYLTKDQVAEMIDAAVNARLQQVKEGA